MLNLHHLKYFHDAAQKRSLVEAARLNRVSHSAISQAIRALESSVGAELLVHARKRFELSPAGERLFRESAGLLASVEKTIRAAKGSEGPPQGRLRLGFSHSIGLSLVSAPLARVCARFSGVEPVVRIGNSRQLEDLLESREIEVGIGMEELWSSRFERTEIMQGAFTLAGRASDTFLIGDKGEEVSLLRGYLRRRRPEARIIEIQSWQLTARLALLGLGSGLVPDFLLKSGEFRKLGRIRLPGLTLPSYRLCAFHRSSSLSAAAAAFIDQFS